MAKVREATADQAERITIEAIDFGGRAGRLGAIPPPTAIATASATTGNPPEGTAW